MGHLQPMSDPVHAVLARRGFTTKERSARRGMRKWRMRNGEWEMLVLMLLLVFILILVLVLVLVLVLEKSSDSLFTCPHH
jgi:hypothetical protein